MDKKKHPSFKLSYESDGKMNTVHSAKKEQRVERDEMFFNTTQNSE